MLGESGWVFCARATICPLPAGLGRARNVPRETLGANEEPREGSCEYAISAMYFLLPTSCQRRTGRQIPDLPDVITLGADCREFRNVSIERFGPFVGSDSNNRHQIQSSPQDGRLRQSSILGESHSQDLRYCPGACGAGPGALRRRRCRGFVNQQPSKDDRGASTVSRASRTICCSNGLVKP